MFLWCPFRRAITKSESKNHFRQMIQVLHENLHLIAPFHSDALGNDRGVAVWTPQNYSTYPEKRYPVLYLQDGMWVFDCDPRHEELKAGVDTWVEQLASNGMTENIILVAIDAAERRDQEYSPAVLGIAYSDFLVDQVKPYIDRHYRTLAEPENTAIAGWSLGALIALYLAWKRPNVFGKAACFSTCFFDCPTDEASEMTLETFNELLGARDFNPAMRLYLDYGSDEHLDGDISQPGTDQTFALIETLKSNSLRAELNYRLFIEDGGKHTVSDWRRRIGRALQFLFPRCEGVATIHL